MPRFLFKTRPILTLGLIPAVTWVGLMGCASSPHLARQSVPPADSVEMDQAKSSDSLTSRVVGSSTISSPSDDVQSGVNDRVVFTATAAKQTPSGMLTIDDRQYQLQLVEPQHRTQVDETGVVTMKHLLIGYQKDGVVDASGEEVIPMPMPEDGSEDDGAIVVNAPSSFAGSTSIEPNTIELNLPSALAMVGGQHPVVGFAQWRVREAYAQLDRAEVLWLPSIQTGFSFYRHDGNLQASDGQIIDANRNSFQYGLGAGAVGAGTTPRPGVVAQFHLADAIFQPKIAEKTAWAREHAASAVLNEQLLRVALAYTELVDAHQDASILAASRGRAAELAKITTDFATAGEGLQADADRMQTELSLVDNRLIAAHERIAVASARLAQAISIESSSQILPLDVNAIPLDLVAAESNKSSLISTGLSTRPELKESQSLVAAACEAFKREKYAPFVPSVLLGYSAGGFGGGFGNNLSNVAGRYDYNAVVTWEVRNLGFGEKAARHESAARVQQAKYEKLKVMDQVAMEVSEAFSQVGFRRQQIEITRKAIETAEQSYQANSERIRNGEGLPIEVLQAVQALESARRAYLQAVIAHNEAQFRLQWALGWPVSAPINTVVGM